MKPGIDYPAVFVSGICHDGNGKVLFRRRGVGARDEQGKWDPGVGGALEVGESIEECLIREIKEEAGVAPHKIELLGHVEKFRELNGIHTHWVGFFYKCSVDPSLVVVDTNETDEIVWTDFHSYPRPSMTGFEDTYEKFKGFF